MNKKGAIPIIFFVIVILIAVIAVGILSTSSLFTTGFAGSVTLLSETNSDGTFRIIGDDTIGTGASEADCSGSLSKSPKSWNFVIYAESNKDLSDYKVNYYNSYNTKVSGIKATGFPIGAGSGISVNPILKITNQECFVESKYKIICKIDVEGQIEPYIDTRGNLNPDDACWYGAPHIETEVKILKTTASIESTEIISEEPQPQIQSQTSETKEDMESLIERILNWIMRLLGI